MPDFDMISHVPWPRSDTRFSFRAHVGFDPPRSSFNKRLFAGDGGSMIDMKFREQASHDETELRALIARWSKAVRHQDLAAIRVDHDPDILMFDVPLPFMSRGLDAYMATWTMFFEWAAKPVQFDFHDIAITAGKDVAFATAVGRCCGLSSGERAQLEFRLTMGFRKEDGRWRIVHEHHSLPAED